MIIADFKLRYQGSALGYLWSLLKPLFLFAILYVVFVKFFRFGEGFPHFPVYLLVGIVLWAFFAEITNNGVRAIVDRGELIRKLNFPKYVIILAGAFSALINLTFNLLVIGVFMIIDGVAIGPVVLLAPFILLELFIFAIAVAFILSALYVKLRDINFVWEVIMQGLFYATPIIYPLSMVSDRWPEAARIMLFSPIAQSIQDFRHVVITPETQTLWSLAGAQKWIAVVPFLVVLIVLAFAVFYFKRRSPYFAEEV